MYVRTRRGEWMSRYWLGQRDGDSMNAHFSHDISSASLHPHDNIRIPRSDLCKAAIAFIIFFIGLAMGGL